MDCNGCTLCCKLLPVEWMDSPAGEYCRECEVDKGCKIYENVPEKCLKFQCAYNQIEPAPIELRPDKCGVVFERIFEIFIGTVDSNITTLSDFAKGQVNSFIKQGFPVVLFKGSEKPLIFVTNEMTANQVWNVIQRERLRRYGNTNI